MVASAKVSFPADGVTWHVKLAIMAKVAAHRGIISNLALLGSFIRCTQACRSHVA